MFSLKSKYFILFCLILSSIIIGTNWFLLTKNFGPSNDEIWGYPAGISLLNNSAYITENEVKLFGLNLPLATGPYMGAFKSYIVALWTFIFGFKFGSLVALNLALSAIFLCVSAWAIAPAVDGKKSLEFALCPILLLPLLDVHFALGSVMDYGPFLIQNICLTLACGFFIRNILNFKNINLFYACFFLGLCLNDKIISAPNVLALSFAYLVNLIINRKHLGNAIKTLPFCLIFGILGMAPFLLYLSKVGLTPMFEMAYGGAAIKSSYLQRLHELYEAFIGNVNSNVFLSSMSGDRIYLPTWPKFLIFWPYFSIIFFCSSLAIYLLNQNDGQNKIFEIILFLFLFLLNSFLLQALVSGLNRPWHIFILYPPCLLLWGLGLSFTAQNISQKKVQLTSAFLLIPLGMQILFSAQSLKIFSNTFGVNIMSSAISDLSNQLISLAPRKLAAINFSIREPLYVLSGGKLNPDDFTWSKKEDLLTRISLEKSISHLVYRIPVNVYPNDKAAYDFLYGHNDVVKDLADFKEVIKVNDRKGTTFVVLERLSEKGESAQK